MSELVTLRAFSSSVDFEMVKAYLESCGIKCYEQDEIINRAYFCNVNDDTNVQCVTYHPQKKALVLKP